MGSSEAAVWQIVAISATLNTWYPAPMDFCVYVLTNTVNQKQYLGICRGAASRRYQTHRKNARRGAHSKLYSALRKYGPEAFMCEEIARVATWDEACAMERKLIAERRLMDVGYNMTSGGEGLYNPSLEVRAKLSAAQKKRGQDPELRRAISHQSKKNWACPAFRANHQIKISAFWDSNAGAKMRSDRAGQLSPFINSPEGQAHIIAQCHANNAKRKAVADERKAAHVFKHSEETRRKLSEAAKRRVQTPEGQAQLKAAVARRIEAGRAK